MLRLLAIVSVFSLSAVAFAEDHYNLEISGGTNAGLDIATGTTSQTSIFLSTEVAAPLMDPFLDAAMDLEFSTQNHSLLAVDGGSFTEIAVVVGPQVNFGDVNPRNSFFLLGGAGLDFSHSDGLSHTEFRFLFKGGKRFMLSNSVSYAPFVEYSKDNDSNGLFRILPLAFSLFL